MAEKTSGEFQNRIGRIEELIQAIDTMPDQAAQRQTRELVQALLDLHGRGINHALEIIHDSGPNGSALIDQLAKDELVSNLLLLHGLHPLDLETRVRQAIEEVKPRLGLHGGSVELLSVSPDGRVQLRLEGNCSGCPSSRVTLHSSIEEALYQAAPDITGLDVLGLVDEPLTAVPNGAAPIFTECPTANGNGTQPQTGVMR